MGFSLKPDSFTSNELYTKVLVKFYSPNRTRPILSWQHVCKLRVDSLLWEGYDMIILFLRWLYQALSASSNKGGGDGG